MSSTIDQEAAEWRAEIERVRDARMARAASVPCALTDAAHCTGPEDCPLGRAPDCPLRLEAEAVSVARRKRQVETEKAEAVAAAAGIPRRLWDRVGVGRDSDDLLDTDALRAVRAMRGTFLVLAGPTGTGKTVAAAWWAWKRRGRFVKASRIARMSWYDEARVDALLSAPALVVDELGTECDDGKGVWRSRIDELFDARYDAALPTVITTNLPEGTMVGGTRTLSGLVGSRIWKRWLETGAVVPCTGADLRATAGEEVPE